MKKMLAIIFFINKALFNNCYLTIMSVTRCRRIIEFLAQLDDKYFTVDVLDLEYKQSINFIVRIVYINMKYNNCDHSVGTIVLIMH